MKGKSLGWFGVLALFFVAAGASLNGLGIVGIWGMVIIMMLPHVAVAACTAGQKLLDKKQSV